MSKSRTVFVVMPFSDASAESIYLHSTKPICQEFGLTVRRADEIFSPNPVLDDIVRAIRCAIVVIVDISGSNPNVFYELGISHILKATSTIMITHDEYRTVPFDISHFRIIQYQDSIKGKAKYERELKSTLKAVLSSMEEFIQQMQADSLVIKASIRNFLGE